MKWCDGVRFITYKAYNTNDGTAEERKKPFDINKKKFEKLIQLAMYTWVFVCVYVCTTIPQRHTGWRNEFSMQPVHFTEPG